MIAFAAVRRRPPRPDSSSNLYIHARRYEDALHSPLQNEATVFFETSGVDLGGKFFFPTILWCWVLVLKRQRPALPPPPPPAAPSLLLEVPGGPSILDSRVPSLCPVPCVP